MSIIERWREDRRAQFAIVIASFVLLTLLGLYLPFGVEWSRTFQKAALDLMQGRDPYGNAYVFQAPWLFVSLIPLAALPEKLGRALFFVISLIGYAYSAYRLGAKPLTIVAFLLSPPVIESLLDVNVDWIPLVGFVLPPQFGLFLIAVKPQIGSVVALLWFVQAWQRGGWREVARVFAPLIIALLLSFAFFGLWPLRFTNAFQLGVNTSLWPFSIPVGLALAVRAFQKNRIEYAMGASLCISPYVGFHSWAGALVAVVQHEAVMIAAVVGLWIVVLLHV